MKCSDYTDEQIRRAVQEADGVKALAARQLGVNRRTLHDRLALMNSGANEKRQTAEYKLDIQGDQATFEGQSSRITNEADIFRVTGLDPAIWRVYRFIVGGWDVTMKMRGEDGDQAKTVQNKQVKAFLERKVPKCLADAAADLMARMEKHAPQYKIGKVRTKGQFLFEPSPFDAHFGALAWAPETGDNWDLKIAEAVFLHAFEKILSRIETFPIKQVVIPLGQDFFHVDYARAQTVHGTQIEDTDGRYAKMFECGFWACVKAIDACRLVAPVSVRWVPGNHDRTISWHLVRTLAAHYAKCKDVGIDYTPTVRKYIEFGVNLIGIAHGDEEKHRDLPLIMAGEAPEAWGRTKHREIHVGHWHKKKETVFNSCDTHTGVRVRVLPSLSGTDYWHYIKGYVNKNRAMEAYLFHEQDGYFGHFSVNAEE